MRLRDFRDFVGRLGIADDENCYCGVLDEKKEHSIGCYPLKRAMAPEVAYGGMDNMSYAAKGISLLVHWDRGCTSSDEAANNLYAALNNKVNYVDSIIYIKMLQNEPVWVGLDDKGIYEYVIECIVYYKKEV